MFLIGAIFRLSFRIAMVKKSYVLVFVALAVVVIIAPPLVYIVHFNDRPITDNPAEWGTFGDYVGGLLNPAIAFMNLVVLGYLTYLLAHQSSEDAKNRAKSEKIKETLKQCEIYMTEIQNAIKELITKRQDVAQALFPHFDGYELKDMSHNGLKNFDPTQFNLVKNALLHQAEIVLLLSRLDSFASTILYGDVDINLAKEIIGRNYYVWAHNFTGFIAFFRKGHDMDYCDRILMLKKIWANNNKIKSESALPFG